MTAEWYYRVEGRTHGPVDVERLKQLARTGRIDPDTPVRGGNDEWVPARRVAGLFDGIAPDPAPPGSGPPPADPWPDEDYALPPAGPGARAAVTAFGVVTLVLATLLTVVGCTTGVGSISCYAASASLLNDAQQQSAAPPAGATAPPPAQGCGPLIAALVGGVLLVLAVVLTVLMLVHLLLAGGHFTVGLGVLRRRRWARTLALVLSVFTGLYGLALLTEVVYRLFQSPAPDGYEAAGQTLAAVVGLVFLCHAVLTWVVMFHPACALQFPPSPSPRRADEPI